MYLDLNHNYDVVLNILKCAVIIVDIFLQIVQIEFNISSTDELKVLTEKTSSLQEQNDRLQEEVNTLKIKYTELENCSEIRDNAFRSLIESEAGQREDAIEKLKAEINEKENQLKEVVIHFRVITILN